MQLHYWIKQVTYQCHFTVCKLDLLRSLQKVKMPYYKITESKFTPFSKAHDTYMPETSFLNASPKHLLHYYFSASEIDTIDFRGMNFGSRVPLCWHNRTVYLTLLTGYELSGGTVFLNTALQQRRADCRKISVERRMLSLQWVIDLATATTSSYLLLLI